MGRRVLILRPQPGAAATAERARKLVLEPIVAPLFTIAPVPWAATDPAAFDAVMLTSANAASMAGPQLRRFTRLPCYAVGDATAAAARRAGFARIVTGPGDAQALVDIAASEGRHRILHLCGADRAEPKTSNLSIEPCIVYEAMSEPELPAAARDAVEAGALVLLHSPRAAALFADLCDRRPRVSIVAISEAAAAAAGSGWASIAWPRQPRDQALLELAAKLCNSAGRAEMDDQ